MSRDTFIKDTKRVLVDTNGNYEGLAYIDTENCIPLSREFIALYVDEACLEACQMLYDLNIQTVNSGANTNGKDNSDDSGFIGIIYETLSDENKTIADLLIAKGVLAERSQYGDQTIIYLRVPLTSRSTVGEVSDALLNLVEKFNKQDVLYGRTTVEDLELQYYPLDDGQYLDLYTHGTINEEEKKAAIIQQLDKLYFDGERYYYVTEDLLIKHLNYLDEIGSIQK